jgi:hypothetical protein
LTRTEFGPNLNCAKGCDELHALGAWFGLYKLALSSSSNTISQKQNTDSNRNNSNQIERQTATHDGIQNTSRMDRLFHIFTCSSFQFRKCCSPWRQTECFSAVLVVRRCKLRFSTPNPTFFLSVFSRFLSFSCSFLFSRSLSVCVRGAVQPMADQC